jgi:dynein heavy chain
MAGYTSVAVRGSIIYFVVADLANVNDMYQNSLQYVKVLFGKAIDNTKPCEELKGRLELLEDTITKLIYTNIARGLFEKDKLLYSFLVATSIRRNLGIISMISWNHLLRGPMPFSAN